MSIKDVEHRLRSTTQKQAYTIEYPLSLKSSCYFTIGCHPKTQSSTCYHLQRVKLSTTRIFKRGSSKPLNCQLTSHLIINSSNTIKLHFCTLTYANFTSNENGNSDSETTSYNKHKTTVILKVYPSPAASSP